MPTAVLAQGLRPLLQKMEPKLREYIAGKQMELAKRLETTYRGVLQKP